MVVGGSYDSMELDQNRMNIPTPKPPHLDSANSARVIRRGKRFESFEHQLFLLLRKTAISQAKLVVRTDTVEKRLRMRETRGKLTI